jgi:transposase
MGRGSSAYGRLTLYADVVRIQRQRVEESSGDDIPRPVVLLLLLLLRRGMAIAVWIGGPGGVDVVIVIFRAAGLWRLRLLVECDRSRNVTLFLIQVSTSFHQEI